jgi:Ca-activated chloride channel homolog
MKAQALALLIAVGLFGIGNQDEPGWLSQALASTDPDVEAAIEAYEAEDLDLAAEHLDAAVARRGERAELYYDRGLLLLAQGDPDGARAAFEHGTESSELQVRASSHYELGNLAMAAEDWQAAIDAYIESLRDQPGHENAKWNLELALQRKEEQEKKEQEEKDKQEQEKNEQEEQDKQEGEEGEQDKQEGEEGEEGEQDKPQEPDEQEGKEGEQDKPQEPDEQEGQQEGEQEQPEPEPGEDQEAPAQPIDSGDLDSALDELDRQDAFMFGRPRGSNREVEKDW